MHEQPGGSLTLVWLAARSILFACAASFVLSMPAKAQSADNSVIYLNQAWSQDDREWYYNFSQGSAVLSYDIFLNLEIAGGQDLFRSDAFHRGLNHCLGDADRQGVWIVLICGRGDQAVPRQITASFW